MGPAAPGGKGLRPAGEGDAAPAAKPVGPLGTAGHRLPVRMPPASPPASARRGDGGVTGRSARAALGLACDGREAALAAEWLIPAALSYGLLVIASHLVDSGLEWMLIR